MKQKQKGLGVPARKTGRSRVAGVPSPKKATAPSSRPSTRSRADARTLAKRRQRSDVIGMALRFEWGNGGSFGDDFTVHTPDGYILRAEQMGNRAWWWQVYYPGEGEVADPQCDLTAPTEYVAKRLCELVYRLHSAIAIAAKIPQRVSARNRSGKRGPKRLREESPKNKK